MESRLYRCVVIHNRIRPKKHRFSYNAFMFYIDVDEIDSIRDKSLFVSRNRFNLYAFHDKDHLQEGEDSIRQNIERFLKSSGIDRKAGTIKLLTNLRTLGHIFNPVSFYFIDDNEGKPLCSIAEVANTFSEQKLYLLDKDTYDGRRFRQKRLKHFYVSPFSDLDTSFSFSLKEPDERLEISINQSDRESTYFFSSLTGEAKPFDDMRLLIYTLRFPLITIGIIWAIHWQALKLYIKGLRVRRKMDQADLQTEVRPYLSRSTSYHNFN